MGSTKPLAGIKVVDFTRVLAGPYCAMLLADLGADVVKVEIPGSGDPLRSQGPPFHHGNGMTYLAANRNKRSLSLDLKSAKGIAIATDLAKRADVLIENFRPDVMPRLGLGYEQLKTAAPRLVYASISGYGADGPDSQSGAFDLTIQALCGYMSITGAADGRPIKLGTSAFDLAAGMNCQAAVVAALFQRLSTGAGQKVETSLLESQVVFLADVALGHFMTGTMPGKSGSGLASKAPHKAFKAADGWVVIDAVSDEHFIGLLSVVKRSSLQRNPRFATSAARFVHRAELYEMLDEAVRERPARSLLRALENAGVPCVAVHSLQQALDHCKAKHRDMVVQTSHPVYGTLPQVASPVRYSAFDVQSDWVAPPTVGEHTEEVLREWLSMPAQEIGALRDEGVV